MQNKITLLFLLLLSTPKINGMIEINEENIKSYFFEAVKSSNTNKINILIETFGQNIIKTKTIDGDTALHIAAKNNDVKMIIFLVDKGIRTNEKNLFGQTALFEALKNKCTKASKALLLVSNTNVIDRSGKTPLHIMAEIDFYNKKIMRRLIQKINVQDNQGRTPLHLAARNGNINFLKMVDKFNLDYTSMYWISIDYLMENNTEQTASEVALDFGHENCYDFLIYKELLHRKNSEKIYVSIPIITF